MKITGILALLLFFLFFPGKALADFNFSTDQTTINADSEITTHVTLSLQGQAGKQYFIEGAFKKDGGSNYFGQSWNDSNWIGYQSSDFLNLKSITTDDSGKWTGDIKVKLDTSSNQFVGNGNYSLQLKRFTTGGSSSASDNSVNFTVQNYQSATSAPSASATPSNNPVNSPDQQTTSSSSKQAFTISPSATNTDVSKSLVINVAISSATANTNYYLKGAFFADGSTNYFGKTLVGSNWVKNSDKYDQQISMTTDGSGNWQGNIQVMPDADDSGFTGHGNYDFKVGRYNASGGSLTWSNSVVIAISGDKPQPTSSTSSQTTSAVDNKSNQASDLNTDTSDLESTYGSSLTDNRDYQIASVAGEATVSATSDHKSNPQLKSPNRVNYYWFAAAGLFFAIGGFILVSFLKNKYDFSNVLQKFKFRGN